MADLNDVLRLLPDSRKANARNWAAYSMLLLPLAANGASVKASTNTQDSSDFICTRIKIYVTDTATPPVENTTPQATVIFQIGEASMMPDGNAVHVQQFAVSAGDRRGHVLEFPIYIQRNTTLVGLFSNLTATAMNVRATFYGIRVFDYLKSDRTL
jgi:hypothetical protein